MAASGFLSNDNVRYYHPADDFTEFTENLLWTEGSSGDIQFVPSILGSGMQPVITQPKFTRSLGVDYTDIVDSTNLTAAFWSSGLFRSGTQQTNIDIGFGDGTFNRNTIIIVKGAATTSFKIDSRIRGTFVEKDWTPDPPNDDGFHFVVVDIRFETSGWRYRVSLDGSGFVDLGVDTQTNLPDANSRVRVQLTSNASPKSVFDEMIFWADNDLFTDQELSNLYELFNTNNTTMDQYTAIFGTPVSSGIDLFTQGKTQTSGNISLFIPGQVETKRLDLFISGFEQISGSMDLHISGSPTIALSSLDLFLQVINPIDDDIILFTAGPLTIDNNIDNFIQGFGVSSGNIDQHIEGKEIISDDVDLFIFGLPAKLLDLFISGPIPIDNDIDKIIIGHIPISGDFSLFIKGAGPDIDAFVGVVSNNPSNDLNLIIHGGTSGTSFTNSRFILFINNSIDDIFVDSEFSSFVKIADPILISDSNIWQAFVKNNNVIDNNIALRIGGHASGDNPNGLLITSSLDIFINGQATQEGDEGLLSEGFSVANTEIFNFTKVHSGLNSTLDLFVSGEVPVIQPSAILDLFIFGILDTVSGSHTLFIPSNESIEDTHDLFIFGVQGIQSGNMLLFVEVTNIGLFDQEFNLYTHGF